MLVSTFALGCSGLYADAVLHQFWFLVEGFRLGNLFKCDFSSFSGFHHQFSNIYDCKALNPKHDMVAMKDLVLKGHNR